MNKKIYKGFKYCQTEPTSKYNYLYKKHITRFNYRLFKINEENRKININKLNHDSKELELNMLISNNKNKIMIIDKRKKYNDIFKAKNTFSNNAMNKTNNKINNNYIGTMSNRKFSLTKTNQFIYKKSFKLNNNQKLCLAPIFLINKDKLKKNRINFENINRNFSSAKSSQRKNQNKMLNIFLEKKNRRRNETEENDMKPKIRFINLKKDLIDETQKINKMFGNYQKQIIEIEKEIKGQINHLYI